ncbi:MAG: hypothetical protein ABJB05_16780 [Parafilimonas sp.]
MEEEIIWTAIASKDFIKKEKNGLVENKDKRKYLRVKSELEII